MNNDSPDTLSKSDIFLHELKARTADSHKNLEELPVSAAIVAPTVSMADYAHYLNLMRAVVADTETAIFPVAKGVFPDLDERRKLAAIENDLAATGAVIRDFGPVFNYHGMTEAFAAGILYVVEGSTLGGRFILRNVTATLGFDENHGAQYFAGYGNKTGSHWKNFLHSLTQYEAAHGNAEEIIAGADFAFRAIHRHFLVHSRV